MKKRTNIAALTAAMIEIVVAASLFQGCAVNKERLLTERIARENDVSVFTVRAERLRQTLRYNRWIDEIQRKKFN